MVAHRQHTQTKSESDLPTVRRRVPRRLIELKIGVLAKGQYSAASMAYELGEGGMLITTNLLLSEQQKIVVTVRIRGVLHGVMLATVVYIHNKDNKVRYGLQFDTVDFDVKRKIRNFVASGSGETANAI